MKELLIKNVRKLKKHQRKELVSLYYKHSIYLTRVIKTLVKFDNSFDLMEFINSIKSWFKVATCHEVAINKSSKVLNLKTHQNHLGLEREYTMHPKAKNISRNRRVKIIWCLLYINLTKISIFEKIEPYKSIEELNSKWKFICEFTNENGVYDELLQAPNGFYYDSNKNLISSSLEDALLEVIGASNPIKILDVLFEHESHKPDPNKEFEYIWLAGYHITNEFFHLLEFDEEDELVNVYRELKRLDNQQINGNTVYLLECIDLSTEKVVRVVQTISNFSMGLYYIDDVSECSCESIKEHYEHSKPL